jgi:hypothetical protein
MKIKNTLSFLYYFLILAIPYFSIIAELTGFSLGIVVNILVFLMLLLFICIHISARDILLLSIILILLIFIILLRNIVYKITFEEISSLRYIFNIPLYYYIFKWLNDKHIINIEKLGRYIVGNTIFQAIFGICSFLFFPKFINNILIKGKTYEEIRLAGGYSHEAGLLVNSNVYANFLVLGLFVYLIQAHWKDQKIYQRIITIILFLFGIVVSQSRFAIVISILFVAIFIIKKLSPNKIIAIFLLVLTVSGIFFPLINKAFKRGYVIKDRVNKIGIAIKIFENNMPLSYVIGVPADDISKQYGDNFIDYFSDNSYFSVILSYGLLFAIFYFIVILLPFFLHRRKKIIYLFFIFYLLTILFITNSIFWNYFFLYIYPVFWIINNKKDSIYSTINIDNQI